MGFLKGPRFYGINRKGMLRRIYSVPPCIQWFADSWGGAKQKLQRKE
jgi:hypothetical protein